jgi:hypothetical protein
MLLRASQRAQWFRNIDISFSVEAPTSMWAFFLDANCTLRWKWLVRCRLSCDAALKPTQFT